MVKTIKKTILNMAEAKNKSYDYGKYEIYHNNGSIASGRVLHSEFLLNRDDIFPAQGDADNERNGDHIYTSGISVHMLFGQKYDRPNVTWRVVVYSVCDYNHRPATINQLFDLVSGNVLLDSVDTDKCKIIKQFYMKPGGAQFTVAVPAGTALAREYTFSRKMYIPYKHKISFNSSGATPEVGRRIFCEVSAYDAYGTIITDNIGYFQGWAKLHYRDP